LVSYQFFQITNETVVGLQPFQDLNRILLLCTNNQGRSNILDTRIMGRKGILPQNLPDGFVDATMQNSLQIRMLIRKLDPASGWTHNSSRGTPIDILPLHPPLTA
jgi:hypothetical protein